MKKARMVMLPLFLILLAAGCSQSEPAGSADQGAVESGKVVEITATNFQFEPAEVKIPANQDVTLKLKLGDGMHGLSIPQLGVTLEGNGDTETVRAKPGKYTFICNIPCGSGHSKMKGTLIAE